MPREASVWSAVARRWDAGRRSWRPLDEIAVGGRDEGERETDAAFDAVVTDRVQQQAAEAMRLLVPFEEVANRAADAVGRTHATVICREVAHGCLTSARRTSPTWRNRAPP